MRAHDWRSSGVAGLRVTGIDGSSCGSVMNYIPQTCPARFPAIEMTVCTGETRRRGLGHGGLSGSRDVGRRAGGARELQPGIASPGRFSVTGVVGADGAKNYRFVPGVACCCLLFACYRRLQQASEGLVSASSTLLLASWLLRVAAIA